MFNNLFFSASVRHFERGVGPGYEVVDFPTMEKGFDEGKKQNLTSMVESPDFFHGSPDFPLPGVGRSLFMKKKKKKKTQI